MKKNPTILEHARENRRKLAPAEGILWQELRGRRLGGFKFRRQHPFEPYILDFFCAEVGLVLELDGKTHLGREKPDQHRQQWLEKHGLEVLRVWNTDVYDDKDVVLEAIWRACDRRQKEAQARDNPSPQPSPRGGEGEDRRGEGEDLTNPLRGERGEEKTPVPGGARGDGISPSPLKGEREKERNGATLVEVLVAIFVMAIGMLALLVLFPLGILRMAQAIQDDRCAHAAANAFAIAAMKDIRTDPTVIGVPDLYQYPEGLVPPPPLLPPGNLPPADPNGRSYPILIDPLGYRQAVGSQQDWLGQAVTKTIRRRTVNWVNTNTDALRWFTFLDDINFDRNTGKPNVTSGFVERDTRYSVAYLCQRPRTIDSTVVDAAVVIYKNRSLGLGAGLSLDEFLYASASDPVSNGAFVTFDTNRTVISVNYGAALNPPPVKPGDWVLDCTFLSYAVGGTAYGSRHGYFYRIVGVTDNPAGLTTELEVAGPFRGFPEGYIPETAPGSGTYAGTIMILDGVVEVFEKGIGKHRFGINAY